eukprot:876194-Amphidinium_carterae.1
MDIADPTKTRTHTHGRVYEPCSLRLTPFKEDAQCEIVSSWRLAAVTGSSYKEDAQCEIVSSWRDWVPSKKTRNVKSFPCVDWLPSKKTPNLKSFPCGDWLPSKKTPN